MISRVLIIAIVSGLVAGVVVTGVQLLRVVPLIKKAIRQHGANGAAEAEAITMIIKRVMMTGIRKGQ